MAIPSRYVPKGFLPLCGIIFLTALFAVQTAIASDGVLLMGDDAIWSGRAGAAVASPGDASWIALNPAGLVDLERRADFGLSLMHYRATLHTQGIAGIPGVDEIADNEFVAVPSAAVVWPLEYGVLGFGSYMPAGAIIHLPESRSIAGYLEGHLDRNLEFIQSRLALAFAYKFDCGLAVGLSINGSLSMARTNQVTWFLLPSQGSNDWDEALGAGFGVGIYRKWERWLVGAAYESRQWAQIFEEYRDITPYPVDLPATFQGGVAFKIMPKLELEVDYRFINWSDTKFFHETNADMGLGWHDQHAVLCGLEWQATPRWTFRAGYAHATHAMTDEHVFGSGLVPNVVQDQVSFGVSHVFNERSELHIALAHWFENHQTDSGRGDVYSLAGAGTRMGLQTEWVSLGYTWKF